MSEESEVRVDVGIDESNKLYPIYISTDYNTYSGGAKDSDMLSVTVDDAVNLANGLLKAVAAYKGENETEENNMKLFLIDSAIENSIGKTVVTSIDLSNGSVKVVLRNDGDYSKAAMEVMLLALKIRPKMILSDKAGYGAVFYDTLVGVMKDHGMTIEKNGDVNYG